MKKRMLQFLLVCVPVAAAVGYLQFRDEPEPEAVAAVPVAVETNATPSVEVRAVVESAPKPVAKPEPKPEPPAPIVVKQKPIPVPKPAAPKPQPRKLTREERIKRYYDNVQRNFERQGQQLDREQNPDRRDRLIAAMARNVRVDTLQTLEWAMGLEDPHERWAALDAINKNALVGIGARIEMDQTGFPKIKDTTIMSAVGSTGMVEPGDYIIGMDDGSGEPVYFDRMPMREVVKHLRGQAGTEIELIMERMNENGEPTAFDVPVQRSLIVMDPP